MERETVRVLFVEDNPQDVEIVRIGAHEVEDPTQLSRHRPREAPYRVETPEQGKLASRWTTSDWVLMTFCCSPMSLWRS